MKLGESYCWFASVLAVAAVYSVEAKPDARNCTYTWFEQPLDHFNGVQESFWQRVCVYDSFWRRQRSEKGEHDVILLYVGNEAPVDLYVNNTGLMWSLAEDLGAVLAFAEHRYFGESIPALQGKENCMAYVNSAQALADYAMLVPQLKARLGLSPRAKVIAFGGSYGGMLAAWFRMRYPHLCDGAVAGSAPVLGFASDKPRLDGSYAAISKGAEDKHGKLDVQCQDSYLAAWVVLDFLSKHMGEAGRKFVAEKLALCGGTFEGGDATEPLIRTLQEVLFLLGEGNFPFPSDYIVFSITKKRGFPLPAWPMRAACQLIKHSRSLVELSGSREDVKYDLKVQLDPENDEDHVVFSVDWNVSKATTSVTPEQLLASPVLESILVGIRNVYGMIYNITGEETCFNLVPPSENDSNKEIHATRDQQDTACHFSQVDMLDAWNSIVCNEGLVLVQDQVRGVGHDMFWPPNVAKEDSYEERIRKADPLGYCESSLPGVTKKPSLLDPMGKWAYAQYEGNDFWQHTSKIIFSNGKYDPWSAAGVLEDFASAEIYSVFLEEGAHHSDFMFETDMDPPSIVSARNKEARIIKKWLGLVDVSQDESRPRSEAQQADIIMEM